MRRTCCVGINSEGYNGEYGGFRTQHCVSPTRLRAAFYVFCLRVAHYSSQQKRGTGRVAYSTTRNDAGV